MNQVPTSWGGLGEAPWQHLPVDPQGHPRLEEPSLRGPSVPLYSGTRCYPVPDFVQALAGLLALCTCSDHAWSRCLALPSKPHQALSSGSSKHSTTRVSAGTTQLSMCVAVGGWGGFSTGPPSSRHMADGSGEPPTS